MKKYQLQIITGILVAAAFVVAQSGVAQKIQFAAIKPAAKGPAMTDEQQGILAVRAVKPSVVDIMGASTSTALHLGAAAPSLTSPDGVRGTGIIISADGLIVSNNHVVEDPTFQYIVMFSDGSKYPAKVLGTDPYDDVALLKIDAHNLPVATLGDSDALETGQTVFAIGDTLGRYQNTVTKGVVSGLDRSVESADTGPGLHPRHEQLIQTDAAINPGNSGGPLINLNGEVVGINTIIDTEGESLGFAIPINLVKNVVNQLQTFGKASRVYLGVQFVTLSQLTVLDNQSGLTEGAYISTVTAGSPADQAGLKQGDVITMVNGQPLNELNQLDSVVANYQAGQQINLIYVRGSQTLQAQVILGQLP